MPKILCCGFDSGGSFLVNLRKHLLSKAEKAKTITHQNMSDEAPKPPKPMTKTSAVPLRKETVRVTLKADDAPAPAAPKAPSAPSAPAAPAAPAAPVAPSAPAAPKPPTASAPGAPAPPKAAAPGPPKPSGSAPAPAPTVALKTAGGAAPGSAPAPAPTVPLKVGGAAPASAPLKTQPLTTPGATAQLPKATVPLGGTQQLGQPTGLQTTPGAIGGFDDDDEVEENATLTSVLAILCLVAALSAFAFQYLTAKTYVEVEAPEPREWAQYFEL